MLKGNRDVEEIRVAVEILTADRNIRHEVLDKQYQPLLVGRCHRHLQLDPWDLRIGYYTANHAQVQLL